MKSVYPALTDEDEAIIQRLVKEGATLWEVRSKFPNQRLHDIRTVYQQFRRGKHMKVNPTPEEMEELKAEVRRHWDIFTFGRRWVGRYAQATDMTLQEAASRLMPR